MSPRKKNTLELYLELITCPFFELENMLVSVVQFFSSHTGASLTTGQAIE